MLQGDDDDEAVGDADHHSDDDDDDAGNYDEMITMMTLRVMPLNMMRAMIFTDIMWNATVKS